SDLIVAESIGLGEIALDGDDLYWVEGRPQEDGRRVIVRLGPDGQTHDVTPAPFNARTRVHEYGGGSFIVDRGTVYFSNFDDQRLYRQDPGGAPRPITASADMRYADAIVDSRRNRLICVREDHSVGGREAVNTIAAVPLDGARGVGEVLVSGSDFYSTPRLNPDGTKLTWLAWNHPNMPWHGTELWVAEIQGDGSLGRAERIAGGVNESIVQPEWSWDGTLIFVSDRTGWWNPYRWGDGTVELLVRMEAEFGWPQWIFGLNLFACESASRLVCTYTQAGNWFLATLDFATHEFKPIETPYTEFAFVQARRGQVFCIAGSATEAPAVVRIDLSTGEARVLRRSSDLVVDPTYLSVPQAIEFPTENGLTAHAFFYPPKNANYTGPPGERPPLIVESHGGPTGAASSTLNLGTQFWTSRGFAVLDVNYGGSTGYGREYWQRLEGQWGIVDLDDCVNGARHMAARGEVDGERLAIHGGSAGGYTTLCAVTFRDVFEAGASYFGISDLEAMARETHKFESRYLDRLIGPYPERHDLYYERSPIHFTDRLSCPILFLQGLEDKVVPPNQAEMMVEALRAKGLPVAYLAFDGEQHGFRRAENIKRSLDAELYFYSRIFGFNAADEIEPIPIENLI
ncbi:MAG TPA: S9 family peptidase, partial [Ardenticatenaceae bacterium]|nr:S9 family peptidase [Ardenticatenaceae bacterium]